MAEGVMLVGPSGCGKGTQSDFIKDTFKYCHVSPGDLLREQIAKRTELGLQAKGALEAGRLVPDDVVNGMVQQKLLAPECSQGFMLDGYPRTMQQAVKLDQLLESANKRLKAVLYFRCDEDTIVERTSGRWVHEASGRTYHAIFKPPHVSKRDDVTGELLSQRVDDRPEVVLQQLANFNEGAGPVLAHYRAKGLVKDIDAQQPVQDVKADVLAVLEGRPPPSMAIIDATIERLKRQIAWLENKKLW